MPDNSDIRVCATMPHGYNRFLTWYRNGDVILFERGNESQVIGFANDIDEFNGLAKTNGIMPVGFGKRSKGWK